MKLYVKKQNEEVVWSEVSDVDAPIHDLIQLQV
jgi:hypothetical protein